MSEIDLDELDRRYETAAKTRNIDDEWQWATSATKHWPAIRDELRLLREFERRLRAYGGLGLPVGYSEFLIETAWLDEQRQQKESP